MNEKHIVSQPPFSTFGLLFGLAGSALLMVAAFALNVHYALASVLPMALSVFLLAIRPVRFRAELTEHGLLVSEPPLEIPYADIESLTVNGSATPTQPGPLIIMHKSGVLETPAYLNVPQLDLFRHLMEKISGSGSREVNVQLADHLRQQIESFGEQKVWTFCARRHLGHRPSSRHFRACWLAVLLTGVVWAFAPSFLDLGRGLEFSPWLPIGSTSIFGGLVGLLYLRSQRRYPATKVIHWDKSSLIVSPGGIAMVQGDSQGILRWDELQDVQFAKKKCKGNITLHVQAAIIRIVDVYDRPLPLIYSVICNYWRPS